jgi:hypothetical protein
MRGRPKRRLGHDLAAQPSGATGLRGLLHARCTRGTARWRAHQRLGGGLTVARCCRRSRGGHGEGAGQGGEDRGAPERRVNGEAVPTTSGGGVHRRGGGSGGGDEVLQLGRGEGVRDLQEISGISSSGRSSPGSGGRRWCSVGIREGEGAADGRRWRSGCGERWGSSGAREKESERSGDGRTSGAARVGSERLSGSATEGKEGKDGGSRAWGCQTARGCCGAWPRPADVARLRPERGAHWRRAPRARACQPDRAGREGADG